MGHPHEFMGNGGMGAGAVRGPARRRRRPRSEPKLICPRCGQPYGYLEVRRTRGREHLCAIHESRAGGRTRPRATPGPRTAISAAQWRALAGAPGDGVGLG
jgi:hypothetical protein